MVDAVTPKGEPNSIVRGDTVKFTRGFPEYLPEDGAVLVYHLVHPEQKKTIATTDNLDSTFLATIAAADSAAYAPGEWAWQAVVTKDSEVFTLDSGTLVVEEGFGALTSGHDDRSFWAKVLEQTETLMLRESVSNDISVSVDGYSATFESKAELMAYHARVKSRVDTEKTIERRRRGQGTGNSIGVRF